MKLIFQITKIGFFLILFVFILSTIGCIIMWFTNLYLDSILNQMILREDTEVFEAWKDPPVKPLICVHIFNYTNMDDPKREKIIVNDTGPYCYRETLHKIDIKFRDGTVTYGDKRSHVFEPTNSSGSMDDIVVVPNFSRIVQEALASKCISWASSKSMFGLDVIWDTFSKPLCTLVVKTDEKAMLTVRAHDLIFGFEKVDESVKKFANFFGYDVPDKLGILSMRAMETRERITVTTGSDNLDTMGVVTAVNGNRKLSAWDDPECNRIDGSDGAFFARHELKKPDTTTLYLFHKDLCRKLPLVYQKESDFQDGVRGLRFHMPPNVYNATGTCYCKDGVCPPAGVFDVSPCFMGVPVLMSFPHFMNAEQSVTAHLEGIHPDPEKHDFFIDIQPILGFTLGTLARMQLNFQIKKPMSKGDYISIFDDFEDGTILPIAWFEVTADRLPPDLFKMIYHASVTVQWIQWFLQWGCLCVFLISGASIICYIRRQKLILRSGHQQEPINGSPTNEVIICRLTSL